MAALDAGPQPGLASLRNAPRQMVPEGRRLMPDGIPGAMAAYITQNKASAFRHA